MSVESPPPSEEPSRAVGSSALDQIDDDDEPATTTATEPAVEEVETFGAAVGVIDPPPDLKGASTRARQGGGGRFHNELELRHTRLESCTHHPYRASITHILPRVFVLRHAHRPLPSPVIIDRTADFVRRVGPQFEGEIIQRNKYEHTAPWMRDRRSEMQHTTQAR